MLAREKIARFSVYLVSVEGRTENTVKTYTGHLNEYAEIMEDAGIDIAAVTKADIEGVYIAYMVAAGNSESTRANKLSAVKMFYKWMYCNEEIASNPMDKVSLPKIPQKKPNVMTSDDIRDVMAAIKANADNGGRSAQRDLALISVMFGTGVRRAEVTNIKLSDVNLAESAIVVHGKGRKDRIVYFNDTVKGILSEYIIRYRAELKNARHSDYLFVSDSGDSEKLSEGMINRIVNKYFDYAGVKSKGFTAHSTRKAFGTKVYESTGDIYAVQNLLGHSSPTTTMKYVAANEKMKKAAACKFEF